MGTSTWSLETSAASTELKRFIAKKCAQMRAEIRAPEHPQSPVSSAFFVAAERGDWPGVFQAIAAMHQAMREGNSRNASWVVYPVEWAVVNEVGAALEEFAEGEEKYAIAFARDIINSVRLEEKSRPAHQTFSHIQEDCSHKPLIESRSNQPNLLTQLGSLLEQLNTLRTR